METVHLLQNTITGVTRMGLTLVYETLHQNGQKIPYGRAGCDEKDCDSRLICWSICAV